MIGVQYSGNDRGGHAQPYVIQNRETAPWLFGGLDIPDGQTLGTVRYGIEFDKMALIGGLVYGLYAAFGGDQHGSTAPSISALL